MNDFIPSCPVIWREDPFRSKLEARWAVFFFTLGIVYKYEPQGFDLGRLGRYWPDFFLPDFGWFEIKPQIEDGGWPNYPKTLAFQEKKGLTFLCGHPGPVPIEDNDGLLSYEGFIENDRGYFWCECPFCGAIGIQYSAWGGRNHHKPECKLLQEFNTPDKHMNSNSPRLAAAYKAARNARFFYE